MRSNMKFFIIVLTLFFISSANADLRGDHFTKSGHFPVNPTNDDDEVYIIAGGCTNGWINPYDEEGNNIAAMNYRCGQCFDELPWKGRFPIDTNFLLLDSGTFDWTCNMVTANYNAAANNYNFTEYVSTNWIAEYNATPTQLESCPYWVTFEVDCWNGAAQ